MNLTISAESKWTGSPVCTDVWLHSFVPLGHHILKKTLSRDFIKAKVYLCRDVWLHSYVPLGHRLCVLLFLAGYLLNLFWFTKIAQGVVRALSRPSPPKKHIQ